VNSEPLRLGFLASGNGSSAQTIIRAIQAGELAATAELLVSNNRSAPALAEAAHLGTPVLCIPTKADPASADVALANALKARSVNLVVMSGYLRRLGPATLGRYAGRVLNIHPGPLPAFGGEGMYGRRVHQAVLAARLNETQIVVHLVDEEYDHGPTLATQAIPVHPGDTPEALESRVKAAEPAFFLETLQRIASGELTLAQAN
jgi:phosphoribosylglycinamide formyltransferase 1